MYICTGSAKLLFLFSERAYTKIHTIKLRNNSNFFFLVFISFRFYRIFFFTKCVYVIKKLVRLAAISKQTKHTNNPICIYDKQNLHKDNVCKRFRIKQSVFSRFIYAQESSLPYELQPFSHHNLWKYTDVLCLKNILD